MSHKELITGVLGVILLSVTSCSGYLDTYPLSSLDKNSVFQSDRTAEAAVLGLYSELNNTVTYNGGAASLGYLTALSADELTNYYSFPPLGIERGQFEENNLQPTNSLVAPLWSDPYHFIYRCNELLEQVSDNDALSPELSKRITGEAAFMRAFHYFYLLNLFGRVPLILTTDFRENLAVMRSPIDSIYKQIVDDLNTAKECLPATFDGASVDRDRLTKWTASALLARVYLYTDRWDKAAQEATQVIGRVELFKLSETLDEVFMKNSRETIWQIKRYSANAEVNATEGRAFIFSDKPTQGALRAGFENHFEEGDQRLHQWIGVSIVNAETYRYPFKYKSVANTPVNERSVVFRLAEQYLIRAEANAQLGLLDPSVSDLDRIRYRAGLGSVTEMEETGTLSGLLSVIEAERLRELFTEWGHRWFDLKRTGRGEAVLGGLKPDWQPDATLYPIPENELLRNPAITDDQNLGY